VSQSTTRILLVRHGRRTDGVDRGLTPEGRRQAAALRDRLASQYSSTDASVAVYSSVLPRAVETATIAAEAFGLAPDAVVQDCGLCTYHQPDELVPVPGGGVFLPFHADEESWSDLVNRVGKSLTRIASRHAKGTAVVVAHDCVVEASLIVFGALPLFRAFDVAVDFTSLTEWTTTDDPTAEWDTSASSWLPVRWRLDRFNDRAHLPV
jgi:broad specificity phosphatase PhoE